MKRLFALVLCLCMVLACAPGVAAQTGNETVEAALAAAPAGGKVTLQQDMTAGQVVITKGVTLDLNGYALTADMVIVFDGAVIDSKGTGKVIVAQDKLAVIADSDTLPVWNGAQGYYTFASVTYQQMLQVAQDGSYAKYIFIPNFDLRSLALLADGSADNDICVKVLLSWNGGASQQFYTFSDALVAQVYSSANANGVCSQVFQLTITGIAGIEDMTVCALVESATGGKISNAQKPEEPEELLPLYTGRYQGQEAKLIVEDEQAYLAVVNYQQASEDDLKEAGITGTVQAAIINKQKFNKVTLKDGTVALREAEAGYYTAFKITGTAAQEYIAYAKNMLAERLEAGDMHQQEYDMLLKMIEGEDIFYESEVDAQITVDAKVTKDALISELVFTYPDYTTTAICQYNNGIVAKETITIVYREGCDYGEDEYRQVVYYADGKTVKLDESYRMEKNADGEWEQTELNYRTEYRENGSMAIQISCWDGYKRVTEYNADEIRIKSTTYNQAGEVVGFEECYPNGGTKKEVEYNDDGTREESEYDVEGNKTRCAYYDAQGVLIDEYTYTYEFYPDGMLKRYEAKNMAGQTVEFGAYTYYEDGLPKTEIGMDKDGNSWEREYYEDGRTKVEADSYADGSEHRSEYYPNGMQKLQVARYADGSKQVAEYDEHGNQTSFAYYDENGNALEAYTCTYEYNSDGTLKRRITWDAAGQIQLTEDYTYYPEGTIKTLVSESSEGRWVVEYYENDCVKSEEGYFTDGSWYRVEYNESGKAQYNSIRDADGSGCDETYNENGDIIKVVYYDENGAVISELGYEYEYDENGKLIKYACYTADGVLVEVKEFTYDEDGNIKSEIGSSVEGSRWEYGYDEDGCRITEVFEYADGSGYRCEYYEHGEGIKLQINVSSDGAKEVWEYNERGAATRRASYDADGVLVEEYTHTYIYNADGIMESYTVKNMAGKIIEFYESTHYESGAIKTEISVSEDGTRREHAYDEDGCLMVEDVRNPDGSGERCEYYEHGNGIKLRIDVQPNGSKEMREYDEKGNQIKYAAYDENGELIAENTYAYAYYPDGSVKSRVVKNMAGQILESEAYTYYADGTLESEIGSDDQGTQWKNLYFENGALKLEHRSWEDGTWREVEYEEDGGWCYRYRDSYGSGYDETYNANGYLLKAMHYNSDGVCFQAQDYVYEFYDNGMLKKQTNYADGEFFGSYEYIYYENGALKTEIRVSADGSSTVYECLENGNPVTYTVYDINGKMVMTTEYTYFAECEWQAQYEITRYADGSREEREYYESGMIKYYTSYDAEGTLVSFESYDENGNLINA